LHFLSSTHRPHTRLSDLWLEWIQDETRIAASSEEIDLLFERALGDYISECMFFGGEISKKNKAVFKKTPAFANKV
jgi:hypothetical protein